MSFWNSTPAWWPEARARGLVRGDAPAAGDEPSPLIIGLALLGALVCVLPLAGLVGLLTGFDVWFYSPVGYVLAVAALAGAGLALRGAPGIFGSCMVLVFWCLAQGLLLARIAHDVRFDDGMVALLSAAVAVLQIVGAALASVLWLKRLMGLACGAALHFLLGYGLLRLVGWQAMLLAPCLLGLAWLAWVWNEPRLLQRRPPLRALAGWAAFADAAMLGVVALAAFYGDAAGFVGLGLMGEDLPGAHSWLAALGLRLPVLLLPLALAVIWRRWKAFAPPAALGLLLWLGCLLTVAAWFDGALVVAGMLAAGALIGGRWRMLIASALLALWELGRFYYLLHWPLAFKALGLAVAGALLLAGLLAQGWLARRGRDEVAGSVAASGALGFSRARLAWLVAGAALVFGAVNWDVRGKEQVIAEGQRILVPLAPVDPRSLMQGDYMALNFSLPAEVREAGEQSLGATLKVVANVDGQGRAEVVRLAGADEAAAGAAAAEQQIVLPLKRLKGRWTLVTDAFFFPEGQGDRYAQARFGDFRVLPDGRALLVGLADAQGAPI